MLDPSIWGEKGQTMRTQMNDLLTEIIWGSSQKGGGEGGIGFGTEKVRAIFLDSLTDL